MGLFHCNEKELKNNFQKKEGIHINNNPFTTQFVGNKIMVINDNGELVDATPENGYYITSANIKVGQLDGEGNPINNDGDESKRKSSKQHKENDAIRTSGKDFVFAMMDGTEKRFASDLNFETLTRLIMLSTYASFSTDGEPSILQIGEKYSTKRPMTTEDIKRILRLSKPTFYRFLEEVTPSTDENGEVVNTPYLFNDDGVYYLNSNYFLRSYLPKGSHHYINKMFVEPVRRLYRAATVPQHRQLGMVFSLMPYINREWNIVCRNPLETDPAYIDALTMKEICEIIGIDKNNSARTINGMIKQIMKITLKIDGARQFFCGLFVTDEDKVMIINPNFVYIGKRADEIMQWGARFVVSEDIEKYRQYKYLFSD